MDYDRYDATLHWIFKQTQGDAWFRPNEDAVPPGVCLRTHDGSFRVFPYEVAALEPFEAAVAALNPLVAVKVRSAAVHAALAECTTDEKADGIYVDANTRIQIMDTMVLLPQADKEQNAAFIRDERVLVVWSDSLDTIIPIARDFEDRLIRLLWRNRPILTSSMISTPSAPTSLSGHSHFGIPQAQEKHLESKSPSPTPPQFRRTWYGRKVITSPSECEKGEQEPSQRTTVLYAPAYNGFAAGLSVVFIGNGIKILVQEYMLDQDYLHFLLLILVPVLFAVSLFFTLQLVQNLAMSFGPIAHYYENSRYYSAIPPKPNKEVDAALPHITIQMPVYKEGLDAVLAPSIESLKRAMQTYARQGGTSSIFVNDDGLRLLPPAEAAARLSFYATHNIGWVARPAHAFNAKINPQGFRRAGRFKKASNLNYALDLSLRMERILERLQSETSSTNLQSSVSTSGLDGCATGPIPGTYGLQYEGRAGNDQGVIPPYVVQGSSGTGTPTRPGTPRASTPVFTGGSGGPNAPSVPLLVIEDLEERALHLAMEEVFQESGGRYRPWAANSRSIRIGPIILLVDADTIVPEDCFRDAAREFAELSSQELAVLQHESDVPDVMQVAHHYFENGIAFFTRRINKCISMACANGEVAPFVGHNAFLRWQALQDAAFIDPADGKQKIWSESNVSEDFDMALRLQLRGYIIRWASYSKGDFKEGVSLTVDDELNRWQKYAYGCSELLFNPLVQWWRKGPINHQIHKFMWSSAPTHYKISMLAYMFSYYGIAVSLTLSFLNYFLLGFQFPVDGFYMHSFEIWLATTIVFFGLGNLGYTLLQYRLGVKNIAWAFLENLMWIPFFFFFFGGLGIPLSLAMLAHLFSYDITWTATKKEVERSNFFKEVPRILKRFWFPFLVCIVLIAGMIIVSTSLVPYQWQLTGNGWAVILPLASVFSIPKSLFLN
ncbi:glycosyl transferase family group 2-domain-containing protein [Boletus edulis BED1]|uniref:Glycosyl transferase family group 2-domain-containing protein n=1 Tax=Boletus edulis BED1 TaxID=1328754 RepID=A0AAD4GHA5_BOLED|nr:glycosyl transferase family group 2-domain-containing protein [Boletus edulis BED1]